MVKLKRIKSDIRREGTNVVYIIIDVGMRGPRRPPVQCCDYCCTHGAAGYCHIVTSIWSSGGAGAGQTVLTRDPPPSPLDPSRPSGAVSAATLYPP